MENGRVSGANFGGGFEKVHTKRSPTSPQAEVGPRLIRFSAERRGTG